MSHEIEEKRSLTNSRLSELIEDYNEAKHDDSFFHNPECITNIWNEIWQVWGERGSILPAVSKLKLRQFELAEIESDGKMLIYLPYELTSPGYDKYLILSKIFPETSTNLLKNPIGMEDKSYNYGWFSIEASIETPYSNTTSAELMWLFTTQGRVGQRLSTYIIGSQFSKLVTNHYLDDITAAPAGNFPQKHMITGPDVSNHFYYARSHNAFRSRLLGTSIRFSL